MLVYESHLVNSRSHGSKTSDFSMIFDQGTLLPPVNEAW